MRGLGDTFAFITKWTGIAWLTKQWSKWTGRDCGCLTRQELLNRKFPFKQRSEK